MHQKLLDFETHRAREVTTLEDIKVLAEVEKVRALENIAKALSAIAEELRKGV